ncbi:MAG: hypothetical protein ABJA98_04130 [Acidobacteriota bacterium]
MYVRQRFVPRAVVAPALGEVLFEGQHRRLAAAQSAHEATAVSVYFFRSSSWNFRKLHSWGMQPYQPVVAFLIRAPSAPIARRSLQCLTGRLKISGNVPGMETG